MSFCKNGRGRYALNIFFSRANPFTGSRPCAIQQKRRTQVRLFCWWTIRVSPIPPKGPLGERRLRLARTLVGFSYRQTKIKTSTRVDDQGISDTPKGPLGERRLRLARTLAGFSYRQTKIKTSTRDVFIFGGRSGTRSRVP